MAGNSIVVGVLRSLLGADISDFVSAMGKSADAAQSFQNQLTATGKTFQEAGIRMTGLKSLILDFSGALDVRKAEEYAAAVQQIGGADKLTEADQKRVNQVMQEALQHYKALGQEAPAHLKALEESTRRLEPATASATDAFTKLRNAVVAVGLVKLVGEAIEFGSHLKDLSARTGESTDELQRLGFAGKQVGLDLDTTAQAINRLQRNLAEGDTKAEEAVAKLGLNTAALLAQSPGQMFESISKALQTIPDPANRTAIAMELLGRNGAELLPLLTSNIDELAKGAHIMSAQTIENLDRLDDAWARLKTNVLSDIGSMIGAFQSVPGAIEKIVELFTGKRFDLEGPARAQKSIDGLVDTVLKAKTPFDNLTDSLKPVPPSLAELEFDANKLTKSLHEGIGAWQAYNAEVKKLGDTLSGRALVPEVKKLHDGLMAAGTLNLTGFESLGKQLDSLILQGAKLTPELEEIHAAWMLNHSILPPVLTDINAVMKGFENLLPVIHANGQEALLTSEAVKHFQGLIKETFNIPGQKVGISLPPPRLEGWDEFLSHAIPGTILRAIEGGGDVLRAAGGTVGNFMFGDKSQFGATIQKSMVSIFGKTIGGAINTILPGIGSLLGPLVDKIGGVLKKAFGFGTAGRDAVKQFADSFGGFDQLHATLSQKLGPDAERLWIALTQGVGRNNPQQAAAAIKAIQDALAGADSKAKLFNASMDTLAGQLGQFQTTAPAALQPFINELLHADNLTDSMREQLQRLSGEPSWEQLQANAEKFGIPLDALGQKFQQLKENATFDELNTALTQFADSGADMNKVLAGMADEVNAVVGDALKFGTDVPEFMKPWLGKMAEAGLLLDENGDKMTDLSKIKFTATESSFDKMAKILEQIRDLLARGIPGAAETAAGQINSSFESIHPTVDVTYAYHTEGEPDINPDQVPRLWHGGIVRRPTLALVGDGGPEAVIPLDAMMNAAATYPTLGSYDMSQFAGAMGGPTMGWSLPTDVNGGRDIVLQLNGREVARGIAFDLIDEVKRLQLTRPR